MAGAFDRYTAGARKALADAQEEARMRSHFYVGTEHLLLGLIYDETSAAATTLLDLGVSLEAVRAELETVLGEGQVSPAGEITLAPSTRKAMDLALREARQLGQEHIDTDHLLLGLIDQGESAGPVLLGKAGANLDRVRQAIIQRRQAED